MTLGAGAGFLIFSPVGEYFGKHLTQATSWYSTSIRAGLDVYPADLAGGLVIRLSKGRGEDSSFTERAADQRASIINRRTSVSSGSRHRASRTAPETRVYTPH